MSDAREVMKAKIAALRAKTAAAGCTEAEALAAAEAAARLMREHAIGEDEFGIVDETIEDAAASPWRTTLLALIARATNTSSIRTLSRGRRPTVTFVGREPGPAIAGYLHTICARAVDRAADEFRTAAPYRRRRSPTTRRAMLRDFRDGMVLRLGQRVLDVFGPQMDERVRLAAERARDAKFPDGRTIALPDRPPRYAEASDAGWDAGGKVPLNRGVGEGAPRARLLIGRPS